MADNRRSTRSAGNHASDRAQPYALIRESVAGPAPPHDPYHAGGDSLLPRELLVFDPVRDGGVDAEAAFLVFLVIGEVALEPFHVAVALEGEDVRGDAVEEPAVVADDDRAAGVVLERLLE